MQIFSVYEIDPCTPVVCKMLSDFCLFTFIMDYSTTGLHSALRADVKTGLAIRLAKLDSYIIQIDNYCSELWAVHRSKG